MKLLNKFLSISSMVLLLVACSDENVTQRTETNTTNQLEQVKNLDDLPDCESENEGEMFWVSSENQVRFCVDEKWYAMENSYSQDSIDSHVSCKTEEMKDKSGIKILCNGDSIGVVEGFSQEDVDEDCVIEFLKNDTLVMGCGSQKVSFVLDYSTLSQMFDIALDSEQVALNIDGIKGYIQKGPFLIGSEVAAYELQNGRTLVQTGNIYHGKISNDRGLFDVRTVRVASQYVFLVAKGFYLNEITGEPSDHPLELTAITDLRNRNTTNVNVLTHLEYDRVIHLVTKMDMSVKNAKKQAERDILKIFFVDTLETDKMFEDLSVGGDGEADAVLLAISILLQRDLNVSSLASALNEIAEAVSEKGTWKNDSVKMAMADWASNMDCSGMLDSIRDNVAKWKLNNGKVPAFEPYVRNFWYKVYGMDDCNKDRVGEIFAVENSISSNDASKTRKRYICVDSSAKDVGFVWRYATDLEKDTYEWPMDLDDGTVKKGSITGKNYVFNSKEKRWDYANKMDIMYGGCQSKYFGKILRYGSQQEFYRCDEIGHVWKPVYDYRDIDTQGWEPGVDGEARWGDSLGVVIKGKDACDLYDAYWNVDIPVKLAGNYCTHSGHRDEELDCLLCEMNCGYIPNSEIVPAFESEKTDVTLTFCNKGKRVCYVYDESTLRWEKGPEEACQLELGGCSSKNRGEKVYKENVMRLYQCSEDNKWVEIRDDVEINTFGKKCDKDKWTLGTVSTESHYVCDAGKWRSASVLEETLKKPCYAKSKGTFSSDSTYACNKSVWDLTTIYDFALGTVNYLNEDLEYGTLTDPRDGQTYRTIKVASATWMAENLNYGDSLASTTMKGQSWCFDNDSLNCYKGGRLYSWSAAMDLIPGFNSASASSLSKIEKVHRGVCPEGWHIPSEEEWAFAGVFRYSAVLSPKDRFFAFADNSLGLSFVAAGTRTGDERVSNFMKYESAFWSVDENDEESSLCIAVLSKYAENFAYRSGTGIGDYSINYEGGCPKKNGYSVRCVKDGSDE